jgi:hypothetical protein
MSITRTATVDCRCGARLEVLVADSLNAARHPHLKQAVLDRALHLFVCGVCRRSITVEKEMLYVDMPRRQFIGVYPSAERLNERLCGEALLEAFQRTVAEDAPQVVRELATSFLVRVVFGYEELREKIVGDDAGLSDLVLEALKGQIMVSDPDWLARGVRTFRLDRVLPDGNFWLLPELADSTLDAAHAIVIERALYDGLFARRAELFADPRGLAAGPSCSLLRLVGAPG